MSNNNHEQTLYEILRVSVTATLAEIKDAYRQRCMEYHPDANPGTNNRFCHEMMCKINEAYRVLRDAEQRKAYDEMLRAKNQYCTNQTSNFEHHSKSHREQSKSFSRPYANEGTYEYYNSVDYDEDAQEDFIMWMENYFESYMNYVILYNKYYLVKKQDILDRLYNLFINNIMTEKSLSKRRTQKKMNRR